MIPDPRALEDNRLILPRLEGRFVQARADSEHPPLAALRRSATPDDRSNGIPIACATLCDGRSEPFIFGTAPAPVDNRGAMNAFGLGGIGTVKGEGKTVRDVRRRVGEEIRDWGDARVKHRGKVR
jgi:hypothetical protein